MTNKTKFGEFQVVHLDSPRHKHRGVKAFAVRDSKQNYIAYCSTEQEAEAKARFFNEDKKGKG